MTKKGSIHLVQLYFLKTRSNGVIVERTAHKSGLNQGFCYPRDYYLTLDCGAELICFFSFSFRVRIRKKIIRDFFFALFFMDWIALHVLVVSVIEGLSCL